MHSGPAPHCNAIHFAVNRTAVRLNRRRKITLRVRLRRECSAKMRFIFWKQRYLHSSLDAVPPHQPLQPCSHRRRVLHRLGCFPIDFDFSTRVGARTPKKK